MLLNRKKGVVWLLYRPIWNVRATVSQWGHVYSKMNSCHTYTHTTAHTSLFQTPLGYFLTHTNVLNREVHPYFRGSCTHFHAAGIVDTVLIREVP